jgi:hypothetical protein
VWSGRYLGVREGTVSFALVEAHGCRVVALRLAVDVPAVAGTTAHIGGGALDITNEQWAEPRLQVELAAVGRRDQTLVIARAGREVRAATANGAPVNFDVQKDACLVTLTVDRETLVEIEFGPGA